MDTEGKLITVNPDFIHDVMYINEDDTLEEEIFSISQEWLEIRKADVNYVLDSIITAKATGSPDDGWNLDHSNPETIQRVIAMTDVDKIGLMGHSLGGQPL